jgi:VWFA-related protein
LLYRFRIISAVIPLFFACAAVLGQQAAPPAAPSGKRSSVSRATRASQEPITKEAVIKVQAPSVVVDVIVTRKGNHVGGLASSDFTVYDNGVPKKIVNFIPPVKAEAAAPPAATSAPSERVPVRDHATALANIHFITLVMDAGDMQPADILRAGAAAQRYVKKVVVPEDYIAIYWLDQSLHLALPFTQDKDRAVAVLEQLSKRAPSGAFTSAERWETMQEIAELENDVYGAGSGAGPGAGQSPNASHDSEMKAVELGTLRAFLWSQSTFQARNVLAALRGIAMAYRSIPGRKNVVLFSQGFVHSPEAKDAFAAVVDAANHANVSFYVVDASGLQSDYSGDTPLYNARPQAESFRVATHGPGTIGLSGYDQFDWSERMGLTTLSDDLGNIATATGGLLVKNQNDLVQGLVLADSDLREFYTLVYQPGDIRYDGTFHNIKVEVADKGIQLRHRRGYWAVPPDDEVMMTPAAAQLLGGVSSGELKPSFAPQVNGALLLDPGGKLSIPVRISVPVRYVKFEKNSKQDQFEARMTLVVTGEDETGRLVTTHQREVHLRLDKKQLADFEKSKEMDINARMAVDRLEPVTLQAILRFSNGTVGIGKQKLSLTGTAGPGCRLTGILLSNRIEKQDADPDPSDPLRGSNFQIFMPAQSRFLQGETITAYFGALDVPIDPASQRPMLRLAFSVKEGSTLVFQLPPEQAVGTPNDNRLRVLKQFDLRNLKPGEYIFEVRGEDSSGHSTTQTATFRVSAS